MSSFVFRFMVNKRRGLSSVVGALLFVVLMVSTFAVLGVALDSQTDIVSTGREVSDLDFKKQKENFVITNVVQTPGNFLEIYANNKGQNPTEIFTLVMTNSSDIASGYPTRTFQIPSDTSFLPPGEDDSKNIVETLDIKMKTPPAGETDTYKFKVISSLGTIKNFNLVCDETGLCGQSIGGGGGSGDLAVQLFLDGPNGVNTKVSTVVMFVSNIGDAALKDVWPDTSCPDLSNSFPSITHAPPTDNLGDFTSCSLTPAADPGCGAGTGICLGAGQTMIFKWDGTVSGDVGDVFSFCNSVSGKQLDDTPVSSNIDCDSLTVIDPNDCGGCDEGGDGGESVIVLDDLLIRPSMFVTLPSPFGSTGGGGQDTDNQGIFGVQVANPTNSTFDISKVTITAFAPGANNNVLIFDKANATHIAPVTSDLSDWNLQDENVMVWRDFVTPITLTPYSSDSFMIKIKPEPNGGRMLESVIVQASVFSTIGSFGKAGYQTTMYSPAGNDWSPIANVFMATAEGTANPANIIGHRNNLSNGTSEEFIVSLADMDDEADTYIKTGAKLIINIPREWTYDGITSTSKFVNSPPTEPQIIEHGDGSTQIIATTNEPLGDVASDEVASIKFRAITPEKEFDRMYIMYILGDGLTETDDSVGPQQEAILHVIGNSTGP